MKLRIIFAATAPIACPLLQAVADDSRFDVPLVVTNPDKPAGRTMAEQPSATKQLAEQLKLPVFQPADINAAGSVKKLRETGADFMVVMAYGQLLGEAVLGLPRHACVNMHASLLPRHRGASPIQSTLLAGDRETGISVMRMVKKMDAGPVYAAFHIPIAPDETALTLHDKLGKLAARKAPAALRAIAKGALAEAQDESLATYCGKIRKADGKINWKEDAKTIARRVRAYAGWPGTHTFFDGQRLKIIQAVFCETPGKPGLVFTLNDKVLVGAESGSVEIKKVQPEGKGIQMIHEFMRGHTGFSGAQL